MDGLTDQDLTAIDEIPIYSIDKRKSESIAVLKILDGSDGGGIEGQTKPKVTKKVS